MPPTKRPFPRFVADASQEGRPYGRWEERLRAEFARGCEPLAAEAGLAARPDDGPMVPGPLLGRARVRARRAAGPPRRRADEDGESVLAEYFGWVSFAPGADGDEPEDLRSRVDFTDVTAEGNPDWRIDLNDDVIGGWRTDGGRGGDVTLVWGLPLVRGAVAATAELDGEPLDQAAGQRRAVHPDRGRRRPRLRRRPVPRGQALGSLGAPARLREPLRGGGVRRRGARRRTRGMRRRLGATLAVVALVGVAVAVLLSVIDGGEGTAAPPAAQPADAQAAPRRAGREGPGEARQAPRDPLHRLGERRPAHAPAAARPGAGQRRRPRVRLRAVLPQAQALHREGRPRPLPRGDADGPGPAVDLPDLQHADRARGLDPPQRLGRLRHGLQPLARRGPGGDRRHGQGAAQERRRAHRLVSVRARARASRRSSTCTG